MITKHAETIAEQVQARIDALEWEQPELARRAGVSQRTINDLMNPDRGIAPTLRTIEAVARALRCEVMDLLAPLPADEALLLDAYRRAKAGRKEAALALLGAPEKTPATPNTPTLPLPHLPAPDGNPDDL
jgi:transcriptional regulator with XRE-family HTH domain